MLDKGQNVAPTAPKPRQVIALLIMRRNAVVQTNELIDELWEEGPPASALTTLQTYVYKLRKILVRHGGKRLLHTRPGGYLLEIPDSSIDLHRIEGAATEGQAALEAGDPDRALDILTRALCTWRAPALVDVEQGTLLSSYATRLEEFRSRILELRIEADLQLGHHRELVSELKSLVLTHPLHEHLHGSLMIALHRSGRRHEALEAFRVLRRNMIEDLGLEPGEELRRLHQALLGDAPVGPPFEARQHSRPTPTPLGAPVSAPHVEPDPAPADDVAPATARQETPVPARTPATTALTAPERPTTPAPVSPVPVPAELPADVPDFTGRDDALDEITAHLTPDEPHGNATRVVVIAGMPGVGKTALAVHLAHRLRHRFEDGQLHVELAGSSDAPLDLMDALHEVLHSLGVPRTHIPEGLEERSKLLRSTTASRRLLLVLDDASSLADLRPLLPGGPHCGVILTSRRRLHGLVGARNVDLQVFPCPEGLDLLASLIGRQRLEQEPEAADRLVSLCGGLPLALRCIGGRLAAMPGLPLARVADQLARSRDIMAELRLGELDVKAGFDAVYGRLSHTDRATFRLLSMLPVDSFSTLAAAELLGCEIPVVERVLQRFVNRYLLQVVRYDHDGMYYAYPSLTWRYARSRLDATLTRPARDGRSARGPHDRSEHGRGTEPGNAVTHSGGHAAVY
ncbi:BTAD domain-containing putative transcriptional regulator [Streptomyces sp. NPDC093249]|uniref:AfsR/SARP family transcriptional regulator n=1 Tax=unclassified Streptomyces TaxID=2593676 RepID=UPI00380594CA